MAARSIRFLLNNEIVELDNVDPNLTVLQYLRETRQLRGTKEGCASGDCGACTVAIASLEEPGANSDVDSDINTREANNKLHYQSVNACICFIGSLHGKQLITVEHLKNNGQLHPVQQAMVENHGSQCGYCTPGFVMSSFVLHKQNPNPDREEVIEALAGNLCRCTGYRPIIDAALKSSKDAPADSFSNNIQQTRQTLIELNQSDSVGLAANNKRFFSPQNIDELAQILLDNPTATLLAGGTDLALETTQQLKSIGQLVYLGKVNELTQINETEQEINIGAAVSYSRFTPLLNEQYPELAQMIGRIGSTQIRNAGTLGGNIGNASPIGDMPPALIALSARLTLRKGHTERQIAVEDFFKDYKVTDLAESEFIKEIHLPKAKEKQHFKVYKISKRIDDDISAVLAAIAIEISDQKVVSSVKVAFGGMAAIPKRAIACEQALLNQPWQQSTIDAAKQALEKDFTPLSDVRASAQYRLKVAQNLIQKCFIELQNDNTTTNTETNIATRVTDYA